MTARVASLIKNVARRRSIVRAGREPFVVLPLDAWEQIEDILAELSSPRLRKSIATGRADYKAGRGVPYREFRKALGIK